jgi:hypothetical protein
MTSNPQLTPPPGRYGPPRRSRPRALVVAAWVLLGVAGVVLAAWLGLRTGSVRLDWHDIAFRVESPEQVQVTFDVTREDPGVPVTCVIEALNESHAQVGVVTVEVAPSDAPRVRMTVPVRTSELAVSATVRSCQEAG